MKKRIVMCSGFLVILAIVLFIVHLMQPIKLAICGIQDPYLFTISNYKNVKVTYGGKFDYENMKFDEKHKVVKDFEFVEPYVYTETFQLTSDESKQLKKLIKNIKEAGSTKPNQIVTDVREIKIDIGGQKYYSIYYSDISDEPAYFREYYNGDLVSVADMLSELSNLQNMIGFERGITN